MNPNLRQFSRLLERTTPRALVNSGVLALVENQGAAWRIARVGALVRGRQRTHRIRVVEVKRSLSILRPPEELYQLWREKMPQSLAHFADVTPIDSQHMRWVVQHPMGRTLEFDTAFVEDRSNELIRWRSLDASGFPNEGEVRFRAAPGDRGAEITLAFRFENGTVDDLLVDTTLRRFKTLVEAGEIPTNAHNPSARAVMENGGFRHASSLLERRQ
jgi:uncharacterized membrane protein